jgi:hypothetical protein
MSYYAKPQYPVYPNDFFDNRINATVVKGLELENKAMRARISELEELIQQREHTAGLASLALKAPSHGPSILCDAEEP